jgi:hypothetical protein
LQLESIQAREVVVVCDGECSGRQVIGAEIDVLVDALDFPVGGGTSGGP